MSLRVSPRDWPAAGAAIIRAVNPAISFKWALFKVHSPSFSWFVRLLRNLSLA
jgi:hypothetical protein